MEILERIAMALQRGDEQQVGSLVAEALGAGLGAGEVLQRGLVAGMDVVGEQFRVREIFLPDVLLAARAMYAGLGLLEPRLASEGVPRRGKILAWDGSSTARPRQSSHWPGAGDKPSPPHKLHGERHPDFVYRTNRTIRKLTLILNPV